MKLIKLITSIFKSTDSKLQKDVIRVRKLADEINRWDDIVKKLDVPFLEEDEEVKEYFLPQKINELRELESEHYDSLYKNGRDKTKYMYRNGKYYVKGRKKDRLKPYFPMTYSYNSSESYYARDYIDDNEPLHEYYLQHDNISSDLLEKTARYEKPSYELAIEDFYNTDLETEEWSQKKS